MLHRSLRITCPSTIPPLENTYQYVPRWSLSYIILQMISNPSFLTLSHRNCSSIFYLKGCGACAYLLIYLFNYLPHDIPTHAESLTGSLHNLKPLLNTSINVLMSTFSQTLQLATLYQLLLSFSSSPSPSVSPFFVSIDTRSTMRHDSIWSYFQHFLHRLPKCLRI